MEEKDGKPEKWGKGRIREPSARGSEHGLGTCER